MTNTTERWGVYAWTMLEDKTLADIHNAFTSQQEAVEEAKRVRDIYDSVVVVPERYFPQAWEMIGAVVGPGR